MNCRQFKPAVMSTGSSSRMWSGDFCFASPPQFSTIPKFTLTLLTYRERQWEITSRLLIGEDAFGGRGESSVALSCHMHVSMFCTSLFIGIVDVWLFPATHTHVAAASSSVTGTDVVTFIHTQWCKAPQLSLWSYCVLSFGSRGASQPSYSNAENFLCVTQCMCLWALDSCGVFFQTAKLMLRCKGAWK